MVLILVIDNMVLPDGVQIGLQTAMGQMLDLITTHTGAKDLARYRIQGYVIRALFFSKFDKLTAPYIAGIAVLSSTRHPTTPSTCR
jgi:hypothetical protein